MHEAHPCVCTCSRGLEPVPTRTCLPRPSSSSALGGTPVGTAVALVAPVAPGLLLATVDAG